VVGARGAGLAARDALELDRVTAAGQADGVDDLGDRPHARVFAVVAGDEQDALLVADFDRQRHVHRREDDGVVEGDQQQRGHSSCPLSRVVAHATIAGLLSLGD
jgi:hypothetical protein